MSNEAHAESQSTGRCSCSHVCRRTGTNRVRFLGPLSIRRSHGLGADRSRGHHRECVRCLERGQRRRTGQGRVLRERRVQAEDPHRDRLRGLADPDLVVGWRRQFQDLRRLRQGHRAGRVAHREVLPSHRRQRANRWEAVRRPEQHRPAGRPVLQQGTVRSGRHRRRPDDVGRVPRRCGHTEGRRHRADLDRRCEQVAAADVAGVPRRPHRWA